MSNTRSKQLMRPLNAQDLINKVLLNLTSFTEDQLHQLLDKAQFELWDRQLEISDGPFATDDEDESEC